MSENPEFNTSTTLVRGTEQISGELDGKVVLLSIASGEYFNMNEVGSRIWALLECPMTFGALLDRLMEEFEVDRPTCEQETVAFLTRLKQDHLVNVMPSEGAAH